MQHLVPLRDQTLQKEAAKQQSNDKLRILFAQKANVVGPWIERQHDTISTIMMNMQSLEQQLQKLKVMEQSLAQYKPNIDELENINKVSVVVALDTTYTTLKSRNQLITATCVSSSKNRKFKRP